MRTKGDRCVLTLPLLAEIWQTHLLEKRFRVIEQLKNDLIQLELHRLNQLERSPEYRRLVKQIEETPPEARKELYREQMAMYRAAGLTEFDFIKDVTPMQKHFAYHVQAQIANGVASDVWNAFRRYLYGNGKEVYFHPKNTLKSVYCPVAGIGMHYKKGFLEWNGGQCANPIKIKVAVQSPRNDYEREMLAKPLVALRVTRKWMKNRYKYYLQFILEGTPPTKNRSLGEGRVGIDLGTKYIGIAALNEVKLAELADQVGKKSLQKAELLRKMDASRRALNPFNYFPDGKIKPRNQCLPWIRSKNYLRYAAKVREIYRKDADIRRYQHNCLANEILAMGNEFYIEDKSFASLARRTRGSTGGNVVSKAPALLVTLLDRKLRCLGVPPLQRLDVFEYKAKHYDHVSDTYRDAKSSQSDSITLANGDVVQRKLYTAFVIMCANKAAQKPDNLLCRAEYERFLRLRDAELECMAEEVCKDQH